MNGGSCENGSLSIESGVFKDSNSFRFDSRAPMVWLSVGEVFGGLLAKSSASPTRVSWPSSESCFPIIDDVDHSADLSAVAAANSFLITASISS